MEQKFIRKSVQSVVFVLKSVGINVHQRTIPWRKFYQFIAVSPTLSAFIHLFLFVFANRNQIKKIVIVAAYLGSAITLLSSIYIFVKNKTKIFKLLEMIDQNVYNYPDENFTTTSKIPDILKEENANKILVLIVFYEFFGFSLSLLSPLLAYLITGVYETSMFPGWYPSFEKPPLIMITSFLQCAGCMAAFWIYFVIQMFIISITVEFLRQYRRLAAALLNIHQRTNNAVFKKMRQDAWYGSIIHFEEEFKEKYDRIFKENLLHCIRHHQQLQKLFYLFEPWFSAFYSMELMMSAATLALIFNNLLSVATNPSTFLTIIGSTFNVLANIFSRCIVGEIFLQMDSKISYIIFYRTNWWEQSIENKKLLYLFHMMTKHKHELKGCFIYTASYYTFSQLLRLSYSYFNIIRSIL